MTRTAFLALLLTILCACSSSDDGNGSGAPDASHGLADASDQVVEDAATGGAMRAPDASVAMPDQTRVLNQFADRPYVLHVPNGLKPPAPVPVVLVLHGGGGSAESTKRVTCPLGNLESADCLDAVADRAGFAVVYPNGTGSRLAPNTRTWNAGGGADGFQCVSGFACKTGVDDLAYFDALLDDLAKTIAVDEKRVFATGISNGGAMSHRLACERADRIAAVAPVASGNQYATTATCAPSRPISVLEIHGTADACWAFEGGPAACAQEDGQSKVSVADTMSGWAERNGCSTTPQSTALPNTAAMDGTTTELQRYEGCDDGVEVTLARVAGGGHTWPGGFKYSQSAGVVSQDFDADTLMLEFFERHPMP